LAGRFAIGAVSTRPTIYRVIPDQDVARDGDVRIVDESGEDYLYPAAWFVPVELPRQVKTSLLRTA